MKRVFALTALTVICFVACSRERLGPPPAGTHKRATTEIIFYLDRNASDELELGVREAYQLWSDATVFKFVYGGKVEGRVSRDGRNKIVIETKWPDELPIGAAAWCQAYVDETGNIVEADILLNAQAYSFTTKREARPGSLYIEDVLAKEIGRSLGIGLGEDGSDHFRAAQAGDNFEPGIDPAEMAAYLSLYEAVKTP
jgi:hypothetical protein